MHTHYRQHFTHAKEIASQTEQYYLSREGKMKATKDPCTRVRWTEAAFTVTTGPSKDPCLCPFFSLHARGYDEPFHQNPYSVPARHQLHQFHSNCGLVRWPKHNLGTFRSRCWNIQPFHGYILQIVWMFRGHFSLCLPISTSRTLTLCSDFLL